MNQLSIKIEAINPVNKSNIETILRKISAMKNVSAAHLIYDDHYRFAFKCYHESLDDRSSILFEIKSLLDLYSSTILSRTYNEEEASV